MSDWQIGDLALCVDDSPPRMIDGLIEAKREYVEALRRGRLYTVTHIVRGCTDASFVGIGDIHQQAGGEATRFIKVTPPEADADDREVIALLVGIPIPAPRPLIHQPLNDGPYGLREVGSLGSIHDTEVRHS